MIKSHKCKQKNHKAFSYPLYLHYYELWGAENFFGNRKLQKTWLVTLSGPLAAILKFTQKCKQTAVSQKLSKIKIFFKIFFASHEVGTIKIFEVPNLAWSVRDLLLSFFSISFEKKLRYLTRRKVELWENIQQMDISLQKFNVNNNDYCRFNILP